MAELFKVNAPVRKPLFEGVQGENEARSIQFDITPWVTELGDGAVTATAKRSQDSQPYPVTVTKDGNTVTWKPTSTDTAFAGVGSFQLEYTVDSVLAKTCIWSTMVAPSLDPAGDPPDPYDNWLAEMREIEASAIQAAQDADESADDAAASAASIAGDHDELINIRIGADGTTYANAGDAVRGQVSGLKSTLTKGLDGADKGIIPYLNFVWELGSMQGGADVYSTTQYRTKGYYPTSAVDYVECSNSAYAGTVYYYTDNAGTYANAYTQFNSTAGLKQAINKTYPYYRVLYIKSDYSALPNLNDVAVYRIAEYQESINELLPLLDDVDDLEAETAKIKEATVSVVSTQSFVGFNNVEKKLLNPDGTLSDFNNSGWKVSELIDISSFDSLIITAGSGYNHLLYAFYNETETFLSGLNSGSGTLNITDEAVAIPSGAKYIRVSRNGGYENHVTSVTTTYKNSANARWADKKWVVVGDSLTAINDRTTKHYFDYVAEATGISVYNMGDSGSGYRAESDLGTAFYQRISNVPTDSDVVTIFGSFNDGISNLGTATDTGTSTLGGCINTTIDNLYAIMPTVQLGIVSPTPWVGANPYNHAEANVYADLLEAICKRRSIPYLNLYYESNLRPWNATFRQLAYSKDEGNGVHPDETGHKIIASRFMAFLESLLI